MGCGGPRADFTRADGLDLGFQPAAIDRALWTHGGDRVTDLEITLVGVLEMVDLASGTFRLRDAVGNGIALHHVAELQGAATLVGQRVSAVGWRGESPRGHFRGVAALTLKPFVLPADLLVVAVPDWEAIAAHTGPDPDGGADLDDEEFADLLAAMKG